MGLREAIGALLGVSAYQPARGYGLDIDDPAVVETRKVIGGNLQPNVTTHLRWYLADLEAAQASADAGNLSSAAQLYNAFRRDGVLAGLLGTRTNGLVRLPKRFYGQKEIADQLRAKNGSRSVFDEMLPPSELALLAADGVALGVGVAELVPVEGREYPVLIRLDPEFLQFRWTESRWYFRSVAGLLPITPGDGRWVLHVPGGRVSPWRSGLWPALGEAFINKQHAKFRRANYAGKLANPARVAVAPNGATEDQRLDFLKKLIAWGTNTVFALPAGWDAKLVESNGKGWEVFEAEISTSDREYMIGLAGQVVSTEGGSGFISENLFRTVRQDLIAGDAEGLAYTVNTQCLPGWIVQRWGIDAIESGTGVEWDADEPKDKASEASTWQTLGTALGALREQLAAAGRSVNLDEVATRFGIPLDPTDVEVEEPDSETTAEARSLAVVGDERQAA